MVSERLTVELVNKYFRGVRLYLAICTPDGCKVDEERYIEFRFCLKGLTRIYWDSEPGYEDWDDYEISVWETISLECCEESNLEFDREEPHRFFDCARYDQVYIWGMGKPVFSWEKP
jgi:hypothetical protein